jgi:hypothetical protein
VTNWPEYGAALIQRGSLTVWMTEFQLDTCGVIAITATGN